MNKLKINTPSIGADPELFLYNKDKNEYIPVCGLIGGTKEKPIPVTNDGLFSLQEDNVMLEYTIPPSKTEEEFTKNINFIKNYIEETVLAPKNLIPKYVASAMFNPKYLKSKAALLFGCSPDYNAWTLDQNKVNGDNPLLRTAGGHIHIGYKDPVFETNIQLIKAMDLFLGVPSILLDTDTERRKVYGKAGAFRNKDYGVEYRVLSTFWTATDELIKWAYTNTLQAIDFVNIDGIITNEDDIIKCINTCDKDMALEIIEDYNINIIKTIKEEQLATIKS